MLSSPPLTRLGGADHGGGVLRSFLQPHHRAVADGEFALVRIVGPKKLDLGNWDEVRPLFDQLEERAARCKTATDLEKWLLHYGELNAAIDEESSRRYIAMTCFTDDSELENPLLENNLFRIFSGLSADNTPLAFICLLLLLSSRCIMLRSLSASAIRSFILARSPFNALKS